MRTTEHRLAELRAEWSRCHGTGDRVRADEIAGEADRIVNPPTSPPPGSCNAATKTNQCAGQARLYPAGWRCDLHSPAAMRRQLAEQERRAAA